MSADRYRTDFDVVVVGGGPAGAATALRLARVGYAVTLLEADRIAHGHYLAARPGETLDPAAGRALAELGLAEVFASTEPLPSYGVRSRWGGPEQVRSHLGSADGPGWHVDRARLDVALAETAAAAGVVWRTGCRVDRVTATPDGWDIDGWCTARVLVDATGRRSPIARRLGARRLCFDRLVAISRTFSDADVDAERYLLVETARDGWWASAPLPGGRVVITLLTDADLCRAGRLSDPTVWIDRLRGTEATAERWWRRVREQSFPGPVVVHPATSTRHLRTDALPWLAVGDAAVSLDPLTGTGFSHALAGAAAAIPAVLGLLAGDRVRLDAYESAQDRLCSDHLRRRLEVYRSARRLDGPFWTRRQGRLRVAA